MNQRSLLIAGPGMHFAEALALRFADDGFEIGLMGRNAEKMQGLSRKLAGTGIKNHAFQADFTNDVSVAGAIEQCATSMPRWECIVYNVKQSHHGDFFNADLNGIAAGLDANVLGAIRLSRYAIANWRRTERAGIILAGGGYKDRPDIDKLSLSISKGALHTLALAMQTNLQEKSVAVGEVVIDGAVREEGPLLPAEVAEAIWQAHAAHANTVIYIPSDRNEVTL